MREATGNLWEIPADVRLITTNGSVRLDGLCVMGRGCAQQAAHRFPRLPYQLGQKIRAHGNRIYSFPEYQLMTFPVKHHWYDVASKPLIKESADALVEVIDPSLQYLLPRPGCGNGGLTWGQVRPLVAMLPDNVTLVTY